MNAVRSKGKSLQNTALMHTPTHSSLLRFSLVLGLAMAFTACKKDDPAPPAAPGGGGGSNTSTPSTTPNFTDADASLWAVRTFSTQSTPIGPIDIEIGLGVGAFTNDGFASFVNVGDVSLNSVALTRQSNNSYVSQPSQTNPTGVDFGTGVEWNVQGGSGFPAFTRSVTAFPFPTVAAITSAETVVRANGYTLTTTQVTGADSVIFLVGSVSKTLAGNATACTFSAAELAGAGTGASLVQIAPYKYNNEVIGGKRIYFGKEMVRTKSVTIQ